jgi:hypothetical protein
MLQLPRELIIQIISLLHYRDLYSLRLANHEIHNLIHENESTIVRKYLSNKLEALQKIFKPPGSLTLSYRMEMRYRLRICRHLSSLLATRCCAKLDPTPRIDDLHTWRKGKAKKLADKLTISLFILYEYLNRFREVVIRSLHEFEECSVKDLSSLGFVLGFDQQKILESFPKESLIPVLQTWRILEGITTSRGLTSNTKSFRYPYITLKTLFMLGGLDRFAALIHRPTLPERMQELDAFSAELWQDKVWKPYATFAGPPLRTIHHLAAPPRRVSSADIPQTMGPTPLTIFITGQYLCERSLQAVILRAKGNLDGVLPLQQYMCDAVKEDGDSSYNFSHWNRPDTSA